MSRALVTQQHVVQAFGPAASPATTEDWISLKNWDHVTVIIQLDTGSTVTALTITLLQATVVAGTDAKELAFTKQWTNADTAASDTLVETAVTSNTFDSKEVDDKLELYVIEVEAADLDQDNDFDCFRVDVTGNANSIASGVYILSRARYSTGGTPSVSAITD